MTAPPAERSHAIAAVDYVGWPMLGLGPEDNSYTIQEVKIPMRDGIKLIADLYEPILPEGQKPVGTILIQCCYGRGMKITFFNARAFAARGYQALFVSTRGTAGSEGTFEPHMVEENDSQDMVKWMRRQSWYQGKFATMGGSYLGYSQYALFRNPPEDCVAAVIPVAPHDQSLHAWGTGSLRLDRISWSETMSPRKKGPPSLLSRLSYPLTYTMSFFRSPGPSELDAVAKTLPLESKLKEHFQGRAPWLFDYLVNQNTDAPYWDLKKQYVALDRVNFPIMLVSGWYDTFTYQTLYQYEHLHKRGIDVKLIIGPWTHYEGGGRFVMPEVMDFMGEHLAQRGEYGRSRVRVLITGSEEWRELPTWPPVTTSKTLYLQKKTGLGTERPEQDANPASFVFDPLNPTPSMGGNQMAGGGRVDDSAYEHRSDVLTFTSKPLSQDLEIIGVPSVVLSHSSDPKFADLFLRLSEVNPQGISHNICEMYQALDPARDSSKPLELKLGACGHRFKAGMRVRFIIAGGAFPMFARNLGTEENRIRSDDTVPQKHVLQIADGVSQLILPVSSDASIAV